MTELAEETTLTRFNKRGVDELVSCVRRSSRGGRVIKVFESYFPQQNKIQVGRQKDKDLEVDRV